MKKVKFWILMSVYVLLALADGALTFYNTPDLSMEGNPLVAKLGLGWGALLVANLLGLALLAVTFGYETFKYKTIYTKEVKLTRYCSQIVYHRPDKFWTGILIKDFRPILAILGFVMPYALIAGRVIIVAEWVCITLRVPIDVYWRINQMLFFGKVEIFVAVAVAIALMLYWMNKEFKTQLPAARELLLSQIGKRREQ
ncbi:MAG: hypothetical protein IJW70_08405 [Clostridia bacterium]|nr:hypothetical protein [Clostridia bacterium]